MQKNPILMDGWKKWNRLNYEVVIGLEVHAQLLTQTKLFCSCSTVYGAPPNSHTCPTCLALPGALPVLNRKAVDYALMIALATNCFVHTESFFARKNYFYPDLPKGYQISQFEHPLAENGWINIGLKHGLKRIGIARIHLEEDAGKSIHNEARNVTCLDFNRCGVPLVEIVSQPVIASPNEAVLYLKKIHTMLRYLRISSGNMEEGSFRCDANLSLRPKGAKGFGTRTELKNMNSFRHLDRALEYEVSRQANILEKGAQVIQETRLWNEHTEKTSSMRSKEEQNDYRYFPEPDLLPLVIDREWLEVIKRTLPELPDEKISRFVEQHHLPEYDAGVLASSRELADYFELCLQETGEPKITSNWIMNELLRELKSNGTDISDCPLPASSLAKLLILIKNGKISGRIAKEVFKEMYRTRKTAESILKHKDLTQINDRDQVALVIKDVLQEHASQVTRYRQGKKKLFGFFVGQTMKKTGGTANPSLVNEILAHLLEPPSEP